MANNLFSALNQEQLQALMHGAELTGEASAAKLAVQPEHLLTVMKKLREGQEFLVDYLADVTAVDRGEAGFEVVYQLFSLKNQAKGTVIARVSRENPQVPSVTPVWPGADWMEREVFDLMGITFAGHPCLKRILMDEDFVGHPLRKDFRMQPPDSEVK